jgi:hypothetical protein
MTLEISYEKHGVLTYSQQQASGVADASGKKVNAKELIKSYIQEYQAQVATKANEEFGNQTESFSLADIGYTGKPIAQLTQSEAADLVSEDGFFGIKQTSQRIADFVIKGAGNDLEMLQAGRAGMLQGFDEAEQLWGEKLPEISYTTMQKALEMVDARIAELGGNVLDTTV